MILYLDTCPVRHAGELSAQFRLRGYDSVHLAAAERVRAMSRGYAEFRFGVFDVRLARAARSLDLPLLLAS